MGNLFKAQDFNKCMINEFINNSADSCINIYNEVIGEEETNCEQLNILDEDVFSKALDMLTNIWETNQR